MKNSYFQIAKKKRKSGCIFCNPYDGMLLFQTDHFRVLADTFPINLGHVMISSKLHYGCAGELLNNVFDELCILKEYIRHVFEKNKMTVVFYEHGRAGCCMSSRTEDVECCEHFHLHCVVTTFSIHEDIKNHFQWFQLPHYKNLPEFFYNYGRYLFFEDTKSNMFFYPALNQEVPAHFLRSLICEKLGNLDQVSWEKYNDEHLHENNNALTRNLFKKPPIYLKKL